ncbi:hypothetical protein PR002_g18839 [Phytophthora rubi]|uniref:Integrase catalytic domain-containing protein n=1 Tax=Phytophthora rubi TaxID=129364 RepID=A0A6A3JT66_9STRA|nr:hypothetical protein PR002_g18839 [Phytophthora rubi]
MTMVDKGLVQGMMLTQRQQDTCDACHLAKQKKKKKKHHNKLDRATKEPNQVVYVDLIFPGKGNGSRFEGVLNKSSDVVNNYLKEYALWAERHAGRMIKKVITHKVTQVLTDKGDEFVNEAIDAWKNSRGIGHIQSLVEMPKAMMEQSGLARSLWPEAMRNAVYIKNRAYNKGTQGVPYLY